MDPNRKCYPNNLHHIPVVSKTRCNNIRKKKYVQKSYKLEHKSYIWYDVILQDFEDSLKIQPIFWNQFKMI